MGWRNIDHVVVLMMENLSFDRVLGWMTLEEHGVDGAVVGRPNPVDHPDIPEGVVRAEPGASLIPPGAPHQPDQMYAQLHGGGIATNLGFAREMAGSTFKRKGGLSREGRAELLREVMRFHARDDLPVTRDLALRFAVADRWFCPIASSTWPNRYFLHYATSPTGMLHLPQVGRGLPSIFSRLNDAGLSWRIYVDGPANVHVCAAIRHEASKARKRALAGGASPEDAVVLRPFERFLCDFSPPPPFDLETPDWPTYTFIEPRHWRTPEREADNDHAGTHMHRGQRLLATIFNRLRADPERWMRTLFVLTYDEFGGYHDHVAPPPAPDPRTGESAGRPTPGSMAWYGARVPTLLVSPWIQPGAYSHVCDHTSILAFMEHRFHLEPLTYRDASADDLTGAFQTSAVAGNGQVPLPPEPLPVAIDDSWRRDHTELELELYRAMAAEEGADGDAEVASLSEDEIARLGEWRGMRLLDDHRAESVPRG